MIDEAEALYGLDPTTFVAERDRVVKALRAEGRKTEAAEVARLRRPLMAEHALNLAARIDTASAQRWVDAVLAVDSAQAGAIAGGAGAADALRTAFADLREATATLVDTAVGTLEVRDRDARRNDVIGIVRALTTPAGAQLVRRGVIGSEPVPEPELFADLPEPPERPTRPDARAPRRARLPAAPGDRNAEGVPAAEPDEGAPLGQLDERRARRDSERRAADERVALDAEIDDARAAVTKTEHDAVTAARALETAQAALDAAERSRREAEHALVVLERRRDDLPPS